MDSSNQSTNNQGNSSGDRSIHQTKSLGNGSKKTVKRPSAVRDFPLNLDSAPVAKRASTSDAGVAKTESATSLFAANSDAGIGNPSRSASPHASAEYHPASPPPAYNHLPFEKTPFAPYLHTTTGAAVTIGDSAIMDPAVARGVMLSGMLPRDRHLFDLMTVIEQAIDRAIQHYHAGLSLLRKIGELHYQAIDRERDTHAHALSKLEAEIAELKGFIGTLAARERDVELENAKLKDQIQTLHVKGREADNRVELMRRQRDRANPRAQNLSDLVGASPGGRKTEHPVSNDMHKTEEE